MKPEEFAPLITVPTEENLAQINFAELFVKHEFKAVMKIKMQFFKWFEDLNKNIIKNNQKFLRKEKRRQMFSSKSQQEENSKNSADDIQMINTENMSVDGNELLKVYGQEEDMNFEED